MEAEERLHPVNTSPNNLLGNHNLSFVHHQNNHNINTETDTDADIRKVMQRGRRQNNGAKVMNGAFAESRRATQRLVFKNGECNVSRANINKRRYEWESDLT